MIGIKTRALLECLYCNDNFILYISTLKKWTISFCRRMMSHPVLRPKPNAPVCVPRNKFHTYVDFINGKSTT